MRCCFFGGNCKHLYEQDVYFAESSCPDVQMGFCMATSGMTQCDLETPPCDLEMELASLKEIESKNETESMGDDQDLKVRIGTAGT